MLQVKDGTCLCPNNVFICQQWVNCMSFDLVNIYFVNILQTFRISAVVKVLRLGEHLPAR
jgi:hypothetical protein